MVFSEENKFITIDKFNGKNLNLCKSTLEMVLATKDLWEIVESLKAPPSSTASDKVKNVFERRCKKILHHHCHEFGGQEVGTHQKMQRTLEAWKKLCNIHETKNLSNILFIRHMFFTIKKDKGDNIPDHINKVKSLANQFIHFDVCIKEDDVVMILFDNLSSLFDHLITE